MAQVTFTPIEVGDKAIAPPVSGFFTSAETQSSNVEDANLRTEGIDDRIVQDASVVSVYSATISDTNSYTYYNSGSGDVDVSSGPKIVQVSGGNNLQISDLGTVDGETEIIRVRWSVCLRTADITGTTVPVVFFELWQTLDGSEGAIPKTRRRLQYDLNTTLEWGCDAVSGVHLLTSTGRLSFLSLRAGIETGGDSFQLSEGSLVATRFKH